MQIFVLGMHGSGTSMLARLLNMLGVYFASEGASTGSDQENSNGFWERRDVRQANDRLLQASGADWDRVGSFSIEKIPEEELKRVQQTICSIVLELDAHRPWFVKDPRLCLLFPVWRPLLELPVCIHIYRHPLEVALSLRERNQLSVPLGLALWERYTLAAFGATAGLPRVLVSHAKLLEFPVKTLRWLAAHLMELGVRGLREPTEAEIEAFVRPGLHQHRLSVAFSARHYLREHHQNLIELIDSGAILQCGSDDLPTVSAYTMDLLAVHDSAGQKVAQQMEKLRENIVAVEKTLEDRSWRFGCNIAALEKTIEKKEVQLRTLHTAVGALQRQFQQAEALRDRWQKEFAKLNEWSERILRDFGRVLRSNRWRIGNWLSFKRAGEQSKEAHRLAQLVASRPRPASGGRHPAQVQSSTAKRKPGGTAASTNEQHITFKETANPAKADVIDVSPYSILFLMNLRAAGGGVNSIVQEANGLRKLGAAVQVAIRRQDESFYRERFPGVARDLFYVSESIAELIGYARQFEFVVATAFKTVRTLKTLLEQAPGVVPCYYIQDYEPNFCQPSEANYREAVESYTLIPEICCFAKTRWLCETVAQKHGVHVHKVEPSLDREIFFSDDRSKPGTPFVVCAMVRPVSEYRSPGLTFEILRRIKREFGQRVEIRMFGLEPNDPFLRRQPVDFEYKVLGILDRQGVAKLMQESSLFIDASTYQAFGRTGLEAMACRCATILPSEGGISEYAVDGVNTLLAAKEGLKTAARYSIERACASELQFFESLRRNIGAERSIRRKTTKVQPGAPGAARITSHDEPRGFVTHPETWVGRGELGRARPYQPTITSFRQFINDQHRYYHECPTKGGILIDVGIQGHLRREDALKLYEMAYYATGDILEFGTNRGLSTSILARAISDSGKSAKIVTMELCPELAGQASRTLSQLDFSRHIEFLVGDADASCQKLVDAGRKFAFAFVDHSHAYGDVVKACHHLSQLLTPGSFCLFHDFNDRRETVEYGVYAAVTQTLDCNQFEFCGIYGCCGLFRRRYV
ncbi:MAG: hypothetical protein DME55_13635 [Verrucomicrobia bacterium]|nr:MAG: hypothetical protein DME55_13635 [Verrucomicrobiota bacterium]